MSSHEMSVMLLGGPHGSMAEQLLDSSDVGAVGQEFRRERVAEPVRMGMDFGNSPQALDGPTETLDAGFEVAAPGPEEITGVRGRQSFEGYPRSFMQQYLQGDSVLQHSQREMSAVRIEGRTPKLGHVGNPQAAVEQHQDQGARALLDVGVLGLIAACDLAAGFQQPPHFVRREWRRREFLHARHAQPLGWIVRDPVPVERPGEEGAQCFEFLAPGAGADGALFSILAPSAWADHARLTVGVQVGRVYRAHGELPARAGREMRQRSAVARERGFPQVAPAASLQESFYGDFYRGPVRTFWGKFFPALQDLDAALGAGGVRGIESFPEWNSVELSVCPDRAIAQRETLPFGSVRAGGQVAPVGRERGLYGGHRAEASIRRFCTWVRTWPVRRLQAIDNNLVACRWLVGHKPTRLSQDKGNGAPAGFLIYRSCNFFHDLCELWPDLYVRTSAEVRS